MLGSEEVGTDRCESGLRSFTHLHKNQFFCGTRPCTRETHTPGGGPDPATVLTPEPKRSGKPSGCYHFCRMRKIRLSARLTKIMEVSGIKKRKFSLSTRTSPGRCPNQENTSGFHQSRRPRPLNAKPTRKIVLPMSPPIFKFSRPARKKRRPPRGGPNPRQTGRLLRKRRRRVPV
jgi:hypothetical protein